MGSGAKHNSDRSAGRDGIRAGVDLARFLLRRYLLVIPLFVVTVNVVFYRVVRSEYLTLWEKHAVDIATDLNRDLLAALVASRIPAAPAEWEPGALAHVDARARRSLRYLHIRRINVFEPSGRVAYSTEPQLGGHVSVVNAKLAQALAGGTASGIERAEDPSDFAEAAHRVDLLETYVPFYTRLEEGRLAGPPAGSFEIYQDVAPLYAGLERLLKIIALGGLGIVALLGLILGVFARRAGGVVDAERAERERLERALEANVINLERAVDDRTRELSEERDTLRSILDGGPSAFVLLNSEGRIIFASRAFGQLTGVDVARARGLRCADLEGAKILCQSCPSREALAGVAPRTVTQRLKRPGAEERWVEHLAVPVHRDGRVARVIEVFSDVTERLRAEENMVRSAKLATVGEVAAVVAHEVRNAVTSVKLLLQLWAERGKDTPDADSLQVALDAHERIEALVGTLLKLARPRSLAPVAQDLVPVVREGLDLVRPEIARCSVRLVERYQSGLPACGLDALLAGEAVVNLVLNAVNAVAESRAPGERRIEVSVRQAEAAEQPGEPALVVEVRDNGPGFTPAALDHALEPFFTTRPEGSGLGLPVAQRIAQDHGGLLRIGNDPGGGAVASIYLPPAVRSV